MIQVAAGVIQDTEGRVLVTRRPDHVHQGGLWEFPGGKLEAGEGLVQGLTRELKEELGIQVVASRPLIRVCHDYGDRQVSLDVYRVTAYAGVARGREGQPLGWIRPADMDPDQFPAADRPIITALRLPVLYLITGEDPADQEVFLSRLSRALDSGVRLVQLRAHGLTDPDYERIAERAFPLCQRHGALLLLNRDPDTVRRLPCHGLHLTGSQLAALRRRPEGGWQWVGASCHSLEGLGQAAQLGLDYALLSPVLRTSSHPEAVPLGWERFAALAEQAVLPVYALGGLGAGDLDQAFAHGAQGVATIRGLWPHQASD